MFLHWQPKTSEGAIGNCYFAHQTKLYSIVNNQVTEVYQFANSSLGWDDFSWASNNTHLLSAPSSGTDYLNFYSVALPSSTQLADPSTMPGYGITGIEWANGANYVALHGAGPQPGESLYYCYKRTGDTLTPISIPTGPNNSIITVSWSPGGTYLLFAGFRNGSGIYDGRSVFLYSRSGDTLTLTNQLVLGNSSPSQGGPTIYSSDWCPTANYMAITGTGYQTTNRYLTVYSYLNGVFTSTWTTSGTSNYFNGSSLACKWSPDGNYLAYGYMLPTGDYYRVELIKGNGSTFTSVSAIDVSIRSSCNLSWSPDGNYLALGSNNGVIIFRKTIDTLKSVYVNYTGGPVKFQL